MDAPISTRLASRRSAALVLLLMVRVLGRINWQVEPFVTMSVDVTGDPIAGRPAPFGLLSTPVKKQHIPAILLIVLHLLGFFVFACAPVVACPVA